MKYSSYKQGYSALRRIINDEELDFSRHFGSFRFVMGDRWRDGKEIRGIYNYKTRNVVAFINKKGNVFVRANSIYAQPLKGSKNKVIEHKNMRIIRNKVDNYMKSRLYMHVMAQTAVDNLIANGDNLGRVLLFKLRRDSDNIDERFIQRQIVKLLKETKKKLPNSLYAIEHGRIFDEAYLQTNDRWYKPHINIIDASEAIAKEEREARIKKEVSEAFYNHIRDIAQDAITSGHSLNPMQFIYTDSEGVEVTGRIKLQRLDLNYPREMPIEDWLRPENVADQIVFEERVGTLESRGIDEMALREERERQEREREEQMMRDMIQYEEMARNMVPGGHIVVPRMNYDRLRQWYATGTNLTSSPYGSGTVVHHAVSNEVTWAGEASSIDRATLEAMSAPMPTPQWEVFEDEYPSTPEEVENIDIDLDTRPMSSA